jgi:TonB family protein
MVEFIVDETGRVTTAEVLHGIGGGCDEEALRIVKAARFRPGEEDGSPVKVKMTMPVTFSLDVVAEDDPAEAALPSVETRSEAELGEVLEFAEKMPELIGGMSVLMSRFKYPDEARQAGISGPVFLEFVVDKEGQVVNPKVTRAFGRGCDEEALRVIQLARYVPGEQQGERVNVKVSLPMPCAPSSR